MPDQDYKFLIAYYLLQPERSIILSRDINDFSEDFRFKLNVNRFIGQGVWIYKAKKIESIHDAEDLACEVNIGGKLAAFEVEEIFERFPLIEGDIESGIYQLYPDEPEYYEIKDAFALTDFIDAEPNFDYRIEKFVCRPDGIYLYSIEHNEELCFYQRHPLTFYDVSCPICNQKVVTYEVARDYLICEAIFLFCPHFIGGADWYGGFAVGYDRKELDNLNINYKLTGENLYFETTNGWQKPIIYTPPNDSSNSYWGNYSENSNYASHFFFVESEPKFWIK